MFRGRASRAGLLWGPERCSSILSRGDPSGLPRGPRSSKNCHGAGAVPGCAHPACLPHHLPDAHRLLRAHCLGGACGRAWALWAQGPWTEVQPHPSLPPGAGQPAARSPPAEEPNGTGIDFPALGGGGGRCNRKPPSLALYLAPHNRRKHSSLLSAAGSVQTLGSPHPRPHPRKPLAGPSGPQTTHAMSSTSGSLAQGTSGRTLGAGAPSRSPRLGGRWEWDLRGAAAQWTRTITGAFLKEAGQPGSARVEAGAPTTPGFAALWPTVAEIPAQAPQKEGPCLLATASAPIPLPPRSHLP